MTHIIARTVDIFTNQLYLIQIIGASVILILSFVLRNLFTQQILAYLHRISKAESHDEDDIKTNLLQCLTAPLGIVFVILGLYCVSAILTLPLDVDIFLDHIFKTLVLVTLFMTLYRIVDPLSFLFDKLSGALGTNLYQEMKGFVVTILKALIVIVGSLSILQGWGVNVAAFLAGLGLIGMAVALAAQDTMKNLFGSLAVLMDQTFKKGEWIKTPEIEGIVESVGLRTTIIRRFDKALVTIPNASLANAAVINFSRMTQRRITWKIGLAYETSSQQLDTIVKRIRQYLEDNKEIETDPKKTTTLIYLDQFDDSSIAVFCYFFTKTTNWKEYMRIKEECLLSFRKIIEEEGGRFAFPSHSIYLGQDANTTKLRALFSDQTQQNSNPVRASKLKKQNQLT